MFGGEMARRCLAALIAAFVFLLSPSAYSGTCTIPAGTEGKVIYNYDYHTYQYCNGTYWIAFDPSVGIATGGPQTIFLTSGTSWTVPSDWNSSNNTIEVIGGGGGGGGGSSAEGDGGAGGGYSIKSNVTLTPGASVTYAVGAAGAAGTNTAGGNGGDTYFCTGTSNCASIAGTAVVVGAKGGGGGHIDGTTLATAGAAASGFGDTKFSGGGSGKGSAWCSNGGGGGGGGAAGPNGNGASGGNCKSVANANAGGGGGGANGGSAGGNASAATTGGNGGNNRLGTGGGAHGNPGGAGTGGGGGGGADGGIASVPNKAGGAGSQDTIWTQTSDSATAGPGGGGGGYGDNNGGAQGPGGAAGGFGAGGGGSSGNTPGVGTQGIIVINYTPAAIPTCGVTSGLLAYWKFDEGSGTSASDSAGTNTGTLVASPTWAAGKVGGALTFNGTSQYLTVPMVAGLRTSTCSVAAWVKTTLDDDETAIGFSKGSGYTDGYTIELGTNASAQLTNELITAFRNVGGTYYQAGYTTATRSQLLDGQWHHFVFTGDGSSTKIYIDGTSRTVSIDNSDSGICTNNANIDTLRIGDQHTGGAEGNFFNGSIDDLRFYNRALSAGEVSQIYNAGAGCAN
jgi:hypothetical protein